MECARACIWAWSMRSRSTRAGGSIWSKGSCKIFGGFGWREAKEVDLERTAGGLSDEDEGAWSPAVAGGEDGGNGESMFMPPLLEFVDPHGLLFVETQGSRVSCVGGVIRGL